MILEYFLYERAPPVVVWGALSLTGCTRISLPQIHFRAKSSESILVVLECLNGHLVASCGSNYRFRRLGAPMPCGAGSSKLCVHKIKKSTSRRIEDVVKVKCTSRYC